MKHSILITGGTGKIGSALCLHFASEGHRVIFTSTNQDKIDALLKEGKDFEGRLVPVLSSFHDADASDYIVEQIKLSGQFPNVVIHNARSIKSLSIGENGVSARDDILTEYDMAVAFPYELTMKLKTESLENVIFISSIYGMVAPNPSLYEDFKQSSPIQYGVAKSAQLHLTKELAVRLAPGIRVNAVSFGGIKGRVDAEFRKRYESLTPMEKMLEEEDVVGPVDFLVGAESANMTGQNIVIDGGWTVW